MIEKKKIEQLPVLPATARGDDRYIGRIRMHKDTIVMDIYDARRITAPDDMEKEAEIAFRWVCDKKNYYTYEFRQQKWITGGITHYTRCQYYYSWTAGIRLDPESEQIAESFLEDLQGIHSYYYQDNKIIGRLRALEDDIRAKKCDRKEQNRCERIEIRQKRRKSLPADWERWLKKNVFKAHRYIFYTARKSGIGTCAYCGEKVSLEKTARHNAAGRCPACGSRIQYKSVGKTPSIKDEKQTIYLQKIEGGILIRYLESVKISMPQGERYENYEIAMDTWIGEKTWRDYCEISGITKEVYWDDRRPADLNRWEPKGYLYTRNIKRDLKGTAFRYAPLAEWMKHEKGEIPVGEFMAEYLKSPFLEFFIKAGLYRLTREYIAWRCNAWTGKDMQEILGIGRQRFLRLVSMDGGIIALGWLRYEERSGCRIPDETLFWLQEKHIRAGGCEEVLSAVESVVRMVNYIKKQDGEPGDVLITWADYLRMAQREGMDITDDVIRFPKHLRLRHDQLVMIGHQEEEKKRLEEYAGLDLEIRGRICEAARYCWEDDDYMIVPAAKCEELMREGRILHHCVGRDDHYMKRMAAGESWILFLRKKEDPDTPYYTIEIDMENDEILQFYSEFDRKPDKKEIEKILNKFKRDVGKCKRVRVPVVA